MMYLHHGNEWVPGPGTAMLLSFGDTLFRDDARGPSESTT